jgi:hypothetical protein
MRRESLRRAHPDETADQIDARLGAWVLDAEPPRRRSPAAEHRW